jgi:hypothetical protein
MIGFIGTSVTVSFNYNQYSAIADLHHLQFTVAHALGISVSTSRLLAADLNTETITSDHYEVFLSTITLYSSSRFVKDMLHSRPCTLSYLTTEFTSLISTLHRPRGT